TTLTGRTSKPFSYNSLLITVDSAKACGSFAKLYLVISYPLAFKFSVTAAIRINSGSTLGPQTPVEQHIAGSKISIFFIVISTPFIFYKSHINSCLYKCLIIYYSSRLFLSINFDGINQFVTFIDINI